MRLGPRLLEPFPASVHNEAMRFILRLCPWTGAAVALTAGLAARAGATVWPDAAARLGAAEAVSAARGMSARRQEASRPPSSDDWETRAVERARPMVLTVRVDGVLSGAAFIVAPGLAVTALHVVGSGRRPLTTAGPDGRTGEATLLRSDPVNDLALLQLETAGAGLPLSPEPPAEVASRPHRAVLIGHPGGRLFTTASTALLGAGSGGRFLISTGLEEGYSGSPVLASAADGRGSAVIGIAVRGSDTRGEIVPASSIAALVGPWLPSRP